MTEQKLNNLADLLGTVVAVTCVVIGLDFIEGTDWYWLPIYTIGVIILTNKLNRIARS